MIQENYIRVKLEIFKLGETIDLCSPTEEFARNSELYSWFNRPDLTIYLDQGINKNTPELKLNILKFTKIKLFLFYRQKITYHVV